MTNKQAHVFIGDAKKPDLINSFDVRLMIKFGKKCNAIMDIRDEEDEEDDDEEEKQELENEKEQTENERETESWL